MSLKAGAAAATALALLAVLVAPAALATDMDLGFSETFGTATLHAEGALEGTAASQVRRLMDANRDGTATQAEADRFVANFQSLLGAYVARLGGNVTLDGRPAVTTEVTNLTFVGAPGPVDDGPPIDFTLEMNFLFTPDDGDTHTFRLVGQPVLGGPLHLRLSVPAGWRIAAAPPGALLALEDAQASLTLPTDGTALAFVMERTARGGPAAGPIVLLAGLAGAGLALRRKGR